MAVLGSQSQVLAIEIAVHQRPRCALADFLQPIPVGGDIAEACLVPLEQHNVVRRQNRIVQMLLYEIAGCLQDFQVAARSSIG